MDILRQDILYALRSLRSRPGHTAAVLLTLALGIGANTALFSVVEGVLLRPLPYHDPASLAIVFEYDRVSGTTREAASVPDYFDFAARNRSFSGLAAFGSGPMSLSGSGAEPALVTVGAVSAGMLPVLGVVPAIGRGFSDADDVPGGEKVAMLGAALWRSRFAADPGIVGRALRLDDELYTVIGVLPEGVQLPAAASDLWIPLQQTAATGSRERHNVSVVGRLRPGVPLERAREEVAALAAQLEREYPDANHGRGATVEPLTAVVVGSVRPALLILLSAVGLVLLIACANVANLLLARGVGRSREIAVRRALGAGVGRLARAFLVEGLVLTVAAAAIGVVFAVWGLDVLLRLAPADLPRLDEVGLDARVLGATLLVAVGTGILFGLLPLVQVRRADLPSITGHGGRTTQGIDRGRLRDGLVVAEVALSVMLVIGAALLIRSLWNLQSVDPGFRTENVVKVDFQLPPSRYPQSFDRYPAWPEVSGLYSQVLQRVGGIPGVREAALANNHPMNAGFTTSFVIEGRESDAASQPEISVRAVSPGYFATVGVPLRRGRVLDGRDRAGAPAVLLVNEAAAHRFFPGRDPIGQRLSFWGSKREIVGVVGNERFRGLADEAPPAVYPPLLQTPMGAVSLLIRTASDPVDAIPALRQAVWSIDPNLALYGVETLAQALAESIARPRFTAVLLGLFAAVALLLASVGVHGVLSYAVVQRTREIGIRLALGAPRGRLSRAILGRALALSLLGVVLGLAGAAITTRLLAGLLFGVTPADPMTFAAAPLVLFGTALLAGYLPARRAARIDPMVLLRSE